MKAAEAQSLRIEISPDEAVSALLIRPPQARACYVFAHGAGAGMTHASMETVAAGLGRARHCDAALSVSLYGKRQQAARCARGRARRRARGGGGSRATLPSLPLIAGGRSFGGRMTSQAQALSPLPGVRGLAFLGFPLHPAGKPSSDRAKHLAEVKIPMLFLQGTRDALAELSLLEPVVKGLGSRATLRLLDGADHSFHVLKSSGRNDREVMDEALDAFAAWVDGVIG